MTGALCSRVRGSSQTSSAVVPDRGLEGRWLTERVIRIEVDRIEVATAVNDPYRWDRFQRWGIEIIPRAERFCVLSFRFVRVDVDFRGGLDGLCGCWCDLVGVFGWS